MGKRVGMGEKGLNWEGECKELVWFDTVERVSNYGDSGYKGWRWDVGRDLYLLGASHPLWRRPAVTVGLSCCPRSWYTHMGQHVPSARWSTCLGSQTLPALWCHREQVPPLLLYSTCGSSKGQQFGKIGFKHFGVRRSTVVKITNWFTNYPALTH